MKCSLIAIVVFLSMAGPSQGGCASTWIFRPGYYTHDPASGLRVAQYMPLPTLAALPDSRPFQSGYHRSRVAQRGAGGTTDDYYRVENWGNAQNGLNAEWERFHDAWSGSTLSGGFGFNPWWPSQFPFGGGFFTSPWGNPGSYGYGAPSGMGGPTGPAPYGAPMPGYGPGYGAGYGPRMNP
jgi:hypothetical protein